MNYLLSHLGNGNNAGFDSRPFTSTPKMPQAQHFGYTQTPYPNMTPSGIPQTPNLSVLTQPVVQDMALQYGEQVCLQLITNYEETDCILANTKRNYLTLFRRRILT